MTVDPDPLFCDRCSTQLVAGKGDFLVVKIEAVADPSPPVIDADATESWSPREFEQLVETAREMSGQELLDQVYRRMTLFLCRPCYNRWIEDPVS